MLKKSAAIITLFSTVLFVSAGDLNDTQLAVLQKQLTEALKKSITKEQAQERLRQLDLYQKENPVRPFKRGIQNRVPRLPMALSKTSASAIERVLIIANKTLYENSTAREKIDRYIQDIRAAHNCEVILETMEGGTPPQVKGVIKGYYNDGGLDGVIQIGKIPEAWYESDNDPTTGRYDKFTCDLYYMDLDGEWTDIDNNGLFDGHTRGSGTLGIEIFYGRIDCTTMGNYGTEVKLLTEYMDKLHNYYMGNVPLNKAALGYLDYDWRTSRNYLNEIYPGSDQNELIRWTENNPPVNKSDYLNNRLQKNYSALQMWCHASYNVHAHHTGGNSSIADIMNTNPKPVAYFHDGCHVSDFAAGRGRAFLGGAYVFNKSPTALMCMSGSRSGQWLGLMARKMFQELAKNTCVGQAFKIWFSEYQNTSEERDKQNFIGWNYGYNIFGDPMITLVEQVPVSIVQKAESALQSGRLYCSVNNGTIDISYMIRDKSPVTIDIFDISGKLIHGIHKGVHNSGIGKTSVSSEIFPAGSYIVVLKSRAGKVSERVFIRD
jgi:hypothetical protein